MHYQILDPSRCTPFLKSKLSLKAKIQSDYTCDLKMHIVNEVGIVIYREKSSLGTIFSGTITAS